MRTDLVAGELTLLQSANYDEHWRLKIANGDGTMIDLSTRLRSGSVNLPNPDSPIGTATVVLQREIGNDTSASLAPLVSSSLNVLDDTVTESPLIQIGRAATLEIAITAVGAARPADGSSAWHEIIGGFVKQPTWPKRRSGDITVEIHDRAYKLMRTYIESPNTYASGTTIEATIQAVLDDVMGSGAYSLTVDDVAAGGTTGSALSVDYEPSVQPVWEALQSLAKSIGWTLWYRYNGSGNPVLTLTEPRRSKTTADYTFSTDQFVDIDQLTIIEEDIRNVVVVSYIDGDGADQTVTAEDSTSISTYGGIRRYMRISEGTESPIRSSAAATVLVNAAIADTKDPDADQAINTIGAWWPGEPSVDLYAFALNSTMYDSELKLAPYAISITFSVGTIAMATIRARGKPSAGSGSWRTRASEDQDDVEKALRSGLQNFREISRTATTIKYGWTIGPNLASSFIHDFQEAQPYTVDKWPVATRIPDSVETSTDVEYTVSIPEAGFIRYFQVEGRKADGSFGDMERVLIFPSGVAADFVAFLEATVNQSDGSVVIEGWTTDRAKSVAYAYNVGTDPTAPTIAMVEAQGTGATGGGLVTGFSSDFTISLGAATLAYGQKIKVLVAAYLNADGTGADGTATDHGLPLGAQAERIKITASDQIDDGIVVSGKLREGTRNWITDIVFSATDWDTVEWTSGTLTLSDGTAYSIDAGNTGNLGTDALRYIYFDSAASTTVLQVVTTASSAVNEDAILLCVAKRASAGSSGGQDAFFIPAVGVMGINSDALSPSSVLEANLGALSVTAAKVAASAIETDKLAGLAVTGPKIAAGAVTAAKITAGTITANEIASSTITTTQIAAGTIVAANIAAGTITATEIAAGTITATEIAAATITGAKIAANTITAANVAAGTITAAEITVASLSALSADMGTITAGQITVGSISINAGTERILMGSATAPTTGVGIFLGKDGTDYELRVGDPSGDYIHWDGSTFHYPTAITNPPLIQSVTLTVNDDGAGNDVDYVVSWTVSDSVTNATHDLVIDCYEDGVGFQTTGTEANPGTATSKTITDVGAGTGVSSDYYVVLTLKAGSAMIDRKQSITEPSTI